MSRRDNADVRCGRCRMLPWLCVCPLLPTPPHATRTRLALFIHKDEARKPTNTGRLAAAHNLDGPGAHFFYKAGRAVAHFRR